MSEPLDSLVTGWKRHFAAADATIEWGGASEALELELAPGVWLVGEVDAWGRTAPDVNNPQGELFFGEWKTANPREKKTWKQVWRMNPQSLSYGVLAAARWPGMSRFTVRKAFKEMTPTYDHVWFRYNEKELDHWEGQLVQIAGEILEYQDNGTIPWPTNFSACFRYGPNYACPFFECACNRQQWATVPAGSTSGGDPAWSATQQRAAIHQKHPGAIVLSPTTVATWLDCRERYRREYVELVTPVKGEALKLGGEFHAELSKFYQGMVKHANSNASD
jgi:hypothetical protein